LSGARELRAQRAVGWAERMSRQVARASQLPSPPVEGSLTRLGTEPAGTSPLNYEKRNGEFLCAGCGANSHRKHRVRRQRS